MAGESLRLLGSKRNDMAKFDFLIFSPPPAAAQPARLPYPPPDPLNGFGPMQGERAKLTFRHNGARARWSLKTWSTLTKLSESFNCIMDQSPTEYKSRGEGAPTLARAPNPSRFVQTHGRTDGRTDGRDTLKTYFVITLTLLGKATEVAKM